MLRLSLNWHLSLVALMLFLIPSTHCLVDYKRDVVTMELWCVAKNNAADSALATAMDWACGPGGADCSPIQSGGPCYDAQDIQIMASYAFNDYYLKHGLSEDACNFSNAAALISLDPSHGSCKFPSSYSINNASYNSGSSSSSKGSSNADTSGSTQAAALWSWSSLVSVYLLVALVL